MGTGYRQDDVNLFLQKQKAFMNRDSEVRGQSVQIKALKAIDAGGVDGVAMADVHRAIKGARLAPEVIRLVVDRLEGMGHIYREEIRTGGRPRVQMWSFRRVLEMPAGDLQTKVKLSCLMSEVLSEDGRPPWECYSREDLIVDILRRADGELNVKDIEVAACQLYAGNPADLVRFLFRSEPGKQARHFLDTLAYRGLIGKVGEAGAMLEGCGEANRGGVRYTWKPSEAYRD
jgi:hypothetical protein